LIQLYVNKRQEQTGKWAVPHNRRTELCKRQEQTGKWAVPHNRRTELCKRQEQSGKWAVPHNRRTELPISVLKFLSPVPSTDTLPPRYAQHLYLQHLILPAHLIQTVPQTAGGYKHRLIRVLLPILTRQVSLTHCTHTGPEHQLSPIQRVNAAPSLGKNRLRREFEYCLEE
jgi:hypothetical protein